MDKEKRNLAVTIALLGILFFSLGKNFLFKKHGGSGTTSVEGSRALTMDNITVLSQIKQNQSIWNAQQSQWDQKEWGRDPFFPEGSESSKFASIPLNLTGIVWDAKMPFAVVNDKVLKNGDMIDNYKVVEIKPNSVIFSTGEETIELQLFQANQKSNRT